MAPDYSTDVCVIGGGPAGSTAAKRLAELGHAVLLVEKAVFPRPHVGICLSDPTRALLDYLGVGQHIHEAAFLRRNDTLVKWGGGEAVTTQQPGMHVDRGRFDEILLTNAQSSGVKTVQGTRCTSIQKLPTGGWKMEFEDPGKTTVAHARFLVDASGRSNMLSGKTVRFAPPLFALHGYWNLQSEPVYDGLMEAGEDGWLWVARLPGRQAMVSVYADPKHVAKNHEGIEAYYHAALERFTELKHFDRTALCGKITGCDAGSRYSVEPVGNDFIRVGDASLAVDPMASQGVHLAISSALQAAVVANTLLRKPDDAAVARAFYRNSQKSRIDMFAQRTAGEYAKVAAYNPHTFWQERAQGMTATPPKPGFILLPDTDVAVKLCPNTQILPTPLLQGDFVVSAPAMHHPNLDQPVAFLGGVDVVPLIGNLGPKHTIYEIISSWEPIVSMALSQQIVDWLWQHGILVHAKD